MENETPKYPSISEQAKNITEATGRVLNNIFSGQTITSPQAVQESRIQTCLRCDKFDKSQRRCYECGCFIDVKVRFALEQCPLGKWIDSDADWIADNEYDRIEYPESDIPTPPKDPKEGEVYTYKGKKWKFSNDTWEFLID